MDEQKSAQSPPRCKCRVSVLLGSLAAIAIGIYYLVSYRPDVVTASKSAAQSLYQSTFVATTGPTQQHVDDVAGASLQSTYSAVRSGAAKPKLAERSPLTGASAPSTAPVPAIVRQRFDRLYHTSPLSVQFWNTGNMVLEHEDAYPEAKVFRGDLLETVVTPFQLRTERRRRLNIALFPSSLLTAQRIDVSFDLRFRVFLFLCAHHLPLSE